MQVFRQLFFFFLSLYISLFIIFFLNYMCGFLIILYNNTREKIKKRLLIFSFGRCKLLLFIYLCYSHKNAYKTHQKKCVTHTIRIRYALKDIIARLALFSTQRRKERKLQLLSTHRTANQDLCFFPLFRSLICPL